MQGAHLAPNHRLLLRIVAAYLPIPLIGAMLSYSYRVGASPEGGPHDVFLRGSPLTPPLFLPALLLAAAWLARRDDRVGSWSAGLAGLVGVAFLLGSTFNLPNDLAAARARAVPVGFTMVLAVVHIVLGSALVWQAVGRLGQRS